jgi:hypothetical protein
VPFVRFSRDKRGYEHVYLVHASGNKRGKPSPSRVLYWFRTPPDIKVGREPFDDATRRVLEAQYPNLTFDWEKIASTHMPPPEFEPWRERRRAERLARQARAVEERDPELPEAESIDPERTEGVVDLSPEPEVSAQAPVGDADEIAAGPIVRPLEGSTSIVPRADAVRSAAGRRRRRRGGRGRSRPQPTAASETSPNAPDASDPSGRSTLHPHEEE